MTIECDSLYNIHFYSDYDRNGRDEYERDRDRGGGGERDRDMGGK